MLGKVWRCSAVFLRCVLKGFDLFGRASALCLERFRSVLRCSCIMLLMVLMCLEVFPPCVFEGFEVSGCVSAL